MTDYQATRARVEDYFDRSATKVWERLTSDAPVSRIRQTVREGRDRMRAVMLSRLPADLRKELMDFLEFLLQRKKQPKESPRRGGVPGLAKGRIVIADDFDAPLDDFKPYME